MFHKMLPKHRPQSVILFLRPSNLQKTSEIKKKTSMINQKSHDVFQKKQRNFLVFNFSMWGFVICIVAICLFLVLLLNVLLRILYLQIWELLQLQVYCCYSLLQSFLFVNCIFAKCAFVICIFEKLASISFFYWSILWFF